MTRLIITLFLLPSLFVLAGAQQKQELFNTSNSNMLLPLPAELESKRSTIPEYYQRRLSANKEAFEPNNAKQDTGFTLVGHWAWGPCSSSDIKGKYAYVGSGPSMLILDISNPSDPQLITEYKTQPDGRGNVNNIKIRDSLLYLLDGASFQILSIKNPTAPKLISILYSFVTDRMVLNDSLAFILHLNNGLLKIVNIKDPYNPFFHKGKGGVGFGETSLSVKDNVAYIGSFDSNGEGLYIFDFRNPDSLGFFDVDYTVGGWVNEVCISDTLLLVGVNARPSNYFKIFSISDPLHPIFLGELYTGSWFDGYQIIGISVRGTSAFFTTGYKGIYEVDISDPTTPKVKNILRQWSNYSSKGTGGAIVLTPKYLFVSTGFGVWCVSRFPEDSLRTKSFFATGGGARDLKIRDTIAYIADYHGMAVLNISNPKRPYRLAEIEAPGESGQIKIQNNYAFLSCAFLGIAIFDISIPTMPKYIGLIPIKLNDGSHPSDFLINENILYALDANDGVIIFDISNKTNPVQTGKYFLQKFNLQLALKDSILYVSRRDSGIVLINVSNPQIPYRVKTLSKFAEGFGILDSLLYVKGDGFLSVYKITSPENPVLIFYQKMDGAYYINSTIVISQNFLYYSLPENIYAIDISNPIFPLMNSSFYAGTGIYNIDAHKSFIYGGDIEKGLRIFKNGYITSVKQNRNNLPIHFNLFQNYPNPFNPVTKIKFTLPNQSYVNLVVYNIIGQEIATVVNKVQESGEHEVLFNASSLASGISSKGEYASGVYFYRITVNNYSESKKMIVIK